MIRRLPVSRRGAVRAVMGVSTLATWPGFVAACTNESEARPGEDDDALLARLIAADAPHIPRRAAPYRISRSLRVPARKTIRIEADTRFLWVGALHSADGGRIAVFAVEGDDVAIQVYKGEAVVEANTPSHMIYAVGARGTRGLTVRGIRGRGCHHVYLDSAVAKYDDVRTREPNRNNPRDIRIIGGGAEHPKLVSQGSGACFLGYVENCEVSGATYRNVAHGVQWWGGDAGTEPWKNGDPANERKCRNLRIRDVVVRNAVGGIWGSMGENVLVRDCVVDGCEDVAFDAEGSNAVTFERCSARNARNGCFATFYYCNGVRFVECAGTVDDKAFPLVRVYNVSQSHAHNRALEIVGGKFTCTDKSGPSTIDTAMGPVRELSLIGATLTNVRVDTAHFNMHRTTISNNILNFPHSIASSAAIRVGASKMLAEAPRATPGGALVEGNQIRYTAGGASTDAPVAIEVYEDDFNSASVDRISGNTISGPFAVAISAVSASGNAGVVPKVDIAGNRFEGLRSGARILTVAQKGHAARAPMIRWEASQTLDGSALSEARARR
jgi:hypothetical protein